MADRDDSDQRRREKLERNPAMRDAGGFWYSIFDWAETVGLVLLFVIVVGVPIVAVILYLGVTTAIEILSDPQVLADIGIGVAVVVAIVGGTVGLAKIL